MSFWRVISEAQSLRTEFLRTTGLSPPVLEGRVAGLHLYPMRRGEQGVMSEMAQQSIRRHAKSGPLRSEVNPIRSF